jgi:hypothetical protein
MKIKRQSIWLYVGPGDGNNVPHFVLSVEPDEIITWSAYDKNDSNSVGHSWKGTEKEFRSQFVPAEAVPG